MAHRKWKETKQLPNLLSGPAVPGCSLVSFHFLWAILCPQDVQGDLGGALRYKNEACTLRRKTQPRLQYQWAAAAARVLLEFPRGPIKVTDRPTDRRTLPGSSLSWLRGEQSGGEMIANGRGEQRKGKRAPFAFHIRYIGFIHVFSKTYKVKYSEWVSVQQEHYSIRRST